MLTHGYNPSTDRLGQKDPKFKPSLSSVLTLSQKIKSWVEAKIFGSTPNTKNKIRHTPIMLAPRKLSQEDHLEFNASLNYKVKLFQKTNNKSSNCIQLTVGE